MNIIFSIVLFAIITLNFYFIKETKRIDKNLNDARDAIVEIIGEISNLSKTYDSDFDSLKDEQIKDDQTNDVQSKDIFDLKSTVFSMHKEFTQLAIQVDGLKQTVDSLVQSAPKRDRIYDGKIEDLRKQIELIKMILGDSDSD